MAEKRGFFTNNLSLKLTALLCAIGLELYFYSPRNAVTAMIPARISIRDVPASMMLVRPRGIENGLSVQVKMRGPGPYMERAKSQDHKFVVDFTGISRNFTAVLKGSELNLPRPIEVLDIIPSRINFMLENVLLKKVPIVADVYGKPPEGYVLEKISVTPKKVVAQGPESEITLLDEVATEPLDLTLLTSSQRFTVPLTEQGALTKLQADTVFVDVVVSPLMVSKTISRVPVEILAPKGFAASVQPSHVKLVLNGPVLVLKDIDEKQLTLTADAKTFKQGLYEVKLNGIFPEGVRIEKTDPEIVSVTVVSEDG